jgi:hypothetical protein
MQRVPSHRVQAAALLLPLVGLFLLLPPFVTLFGGPTRVFGVPLIVFYLFAVWGALTLAAALLARRLPLTDADPAAAADGADTLAT